VAGEDPLEAARRELLEEGAHTAQEWTHLLTTYPTPGLSSERHVYYVARGLHHVPDRGGFQLVHEEAEMTTSWAPVDELVEGILDGRLTDGPLVTAIGTYRLRGF
jgi:ADP-ribose pyrophosphatase